MRVSLPVVIALAGFAAAQTPTTTAGSTSTSCAAQNIVDNCLSTEQLQVQACAPNDWKCLCNAQTQVVTCYNNCPGDPAKVAADQYLTTWCNAAGLASSQSAQLSSVTATNTNSPSSVNTMAAPTTMTSATATFNTGTSTKAAATGAAANVLSPVGGIAAALMGLIAVV